MCAAEIESFLGVGEPPWHDLGITLDNPPSIGEAIKLAGLDWTVTTEEIFLANGQKVPDARATVRTSDGSVLGVVGPRFRPLQNADAFRFFDPIISAGDATIETAGALKKGRRVWILAKIAGDPIEIVRNDPVQAYLLLAHAHDGTLAVHVGFTPIRVVCQNTLSASLSHEDSHLIRVRHTAKVEETLNEVREIMNVSRRVFEATSEQYKLLASRDINTEDLEKYVRLVVLGKIEVVDLSEEEEEKGRRVVDKILPLFDGGTGNDLPGVAGTWWAAYNAVTEFTSHIRGRSQDTRVDSLWFGPSKTMSQNALSLALEMSE
jgi:phage/plasmid-like protein (TIGR03299 family)